MQLNKLIITNFGLYRGRHEFDLVPRVKYGHKRPIVLFGGNNGAGKTTLLEAVKLALYGPAFLGTRVSRNEYLEYLSNRIHRNKFSLLPLNFASVEVEFEYVESSQRSVFNVCRSWLKTQRSVQEELSVTRDQKPISDGDTEFWQTFIDQTVPQGLSNLFFFDGEKIKSLAEESTSTQELADSIKSLLGLDLIDRLHADIKIYMGRIIKTESPEGRDLLSKLEDEITAIDSRITGLRQESAQCLASMDHLNNTIAKTEASLSHLGGGYASHRTEWQVRIHQLKSDISGLENQIREMSEGLLPFLSCPELLQELKKQLLLERGILQQRSSVTYLEGRLEKITKHLSGDKKVWSGTGLDKPGIARLSKSVIDFISSTLSADEENKDRAIIHGLSSQETDALLMDIERCEKDLPAQVRSIAETLETKTRELQELQLKVQKAPDEDAIKPLILQLSELNRESGGFSQKIDNLDEELRQVEFEKLKMQRQAEKIKEQLLKNEKLIRKIDLLEKIQISLNHYQEQLKTSRLDRLKHNVVECLNRLMRKTSFVTDVDIDPREFTVTLYDKHHRQIRKKDLSSGEKQIYAVAMLWALGKTSGRALPVIIDTPLGRLDSQHRFKLVDSYFPFASHQIIILSTDTEIDLKYFDHLASYISHTYFLSYNEEEEMTEVSEKYFSLESEKGRRELVTADK